MTPQSAKAKGRRFQQWVAKKISEITDIKCGKDCDIEPREMGQSGCDVKLYGPAYEMYPFCVECKNTERWNLPEAIRQAEANTVDIRTWQVFLKRNRQRAVVVMDAEVWFEICEQWIRSIWE